MKRSLRGALVLLQAVVVATTLSLTTAGPVSAFCFTSSKWAETAYRMHVQYYVPEAWEPALAQAAGQWNNTSAVHYTASFESNQWWNFNLDNTDFAYYGFPDVPGLTQNQQINNGRHNRSDVHLNNNFNWNVDGVMNQAQRKVDVRTIAVHEIGHSTGLHHPSICGAMTANEVEAAMNPNWTTKRYTRTDDDAGNRALYP